MVKGIINKSNTLIYILTNVYYAWTQVLQYEILSAFLFVNLEYLGQCRSKNELY